MQQEFVGAIPFLSTPRPTTERSLYPLVISRKVSGRTHSEPVTYTKDDAGINLRHLAGARPQPLSSCLLLASHQI